jgi:hypothetical protein
MGQKNDVDDLGEWFWSRGVSCLIRALSLHGLSGSSSLLGDDGTAPGDAVDRGGSAGDPDLANDSMSTLFANADDDAYEPTPVVIPVRGALTALNQVAW